MWISALADVDELTRMATPCNNIRSLYFLIPTLIQMSHMYIYLLIEVRRRIAMGKAAMGGLTSMEGQRSNDGDKSETIESFGVPDCSLRSGDLDNEKT